MTLVLMATQSPQFTKTINLHEKCRFFCVSQKIIVPLQPNRALVAKNNKFVPLRAVLPSAPGKEKNKIHKASIE